MQTVVKYTRRESREREIRIPEHAANSMELEPTSRKTKGVWSWCSWEGLQMAKHRRYSEFGALLEWSNHRKFLHSPRLYNCCSPRIRILAHPNGAQRQTKLTYQQKRRPYEALINDVANGETSEEIVWHLAPFAGSVHA